MKNWTTMDDVCKIMIVSVVSYDKKRMCGMVKDPLLDEEWSFSGAEQFFRLITDWLIPSWNKTQKEGRRKSPGRAKKQAALSDRPAPQAKFYLQVLFEQNNTWQGTLRWIDQNMQAPFRSALELIRLMDSALDEQCASVGEKHVGQG